MAEENGTMVALVTGANKGIGREISRQLGEQGMTVLLGARDETRGRKAAEELRDEGVDARFLHVDVTDEETIRTAAERIEGEFGRLDVLVNNAGIGVGPEQPSEYGPEVVRRNYETNVFGVVAVTHAMLPLLRRSPAARVVNMSSPLGSLTLMSDPDHPVAGVGLLAYNSSKAALNAITLLYANELRDTGILVNAANPGFVATDLTTSTRGNSASSRARELRFDWRRYPTMGRRASSSVKMERCPGKARVNSMRASSATWSKSVSGHDRFGTTDRGRFEVSPTLVCADEPACNSSQPKCSS